MKKTTTNNRRQFLKNFSLASMGVGLFPAVAQSYVYQKSGSSAALDCEITTLDYYGEGPFPVDGEVMNSIEEALKAAGEGDE